jgi:hypothetical protein
LLAIASLWPCRPLHSQPTYWSHVNVNGTDVLTPNWQLFNFKVYGATPGYFLHVSANGTIDSQPASGGGGATLPSPCVVYGTSSTAGRCALASDVTGLLGYIPAQTASLTGALATGLLARYDFQQGSGTSLADLSGNGNTGTLGGGGTAAPTWLSNGLQTAANSNQGVVLPAALNVARTIAIAYYQPPLNIAAGSPVIGFQGYGNIVTSSTAPSGLNILDSALCCGIGFGSGGIFNHTATSLELSGLHVRIYTLGTGSGDNDHIYVDGVEAPYATQTASAGLQSSGVLAIGSANGGPFIGGDGLVTFYDAFFYSTELSAANALQLTQYIQADLASRGVPTQPFPQPTGVPTLHCIGDSIQALGACSQLTLLNQPAYNVEQWGIGGAQLRAFTASEPNRVAAMCNDLGAGPNVAFVEGGQNDISTGASLATIYTWYLAEVQTLHRAGCKVFAMPLLSSTADPDKDTFNALLRKTVLQNGADGIADDAADPVLGADGACSNTTYFIGDCLHPGTTAGIAHMAAAMSNALNYYFGSSPASPTVVTTASYTMTAADAYVEVPVTSGVGNVILTLPDCIGQTGAVYKINFLSNSGTALFLKNAVSAEPINGADYSSSPFQAINGVNGTVSLRDVANSQVTAGCHWDFSAF